MTEWAFFLLELFFLSVAWLMYRPQRSEASPPPPAGSAAELQVLMENLDVCVCALRCETGELLYANRKMRDEFGLPGDCAGKSCAEIFERKHPCCSLCPDLFLLKNQEGHLVWEEYNATTGKCYKNTDCLVDWPDGNKVRMRCFVDITEERLSEATIKKQFEQQQLLSTISLDFSSMDDTDVQIEHALSLLGNALALCRVCLFQDHPETECYECVSAWHREEIPPLEKHFPIPYSGHGAKYRRFSQSQTLSFVDASLVLGNLPELENSGAGNYACVPIYISGIYWGFLGLNECGGQRREWLESERKMLQTVGGIFSTVLQRRKDAIDLYRTQQTLQTVLDNVPGAIFWKDAEFVYRGCNKFFSDLVRLPPEKILGFTASDIIPLSAGEAHAEESNVLETGMPSMDREQELTLLSGESFWVRTSKVPVFDEKGDLLCILGIMMDVTESKMHELALQEALQNAQNANEAKSEFLSRMSHEIRSPMNAIIGMTKIAMRTQDEKRIAHCLEKIDGSSRHLLSLINDILDMSKIEANKLQLQSEPFDIEKMLMEVSHVIGVRAEEKKQNLSFRLDPSLRRQYVGDELRLAQVVTNLLTNAVKFTPAYGSITLSARQLQRDEESAVLEITVADNGIGISEEHRKRLFAPFEQADGSISRKFGGTGLGLVISKNIVELMEGDIEIRSEEGKGTTFVFTVRLQAVDERLAPRPRGHLNIRVLFVDDDEETRDYFALIMKDLKIDADTAGGGKEAVNKVREAENGGSSYDIVFMDWRMPEMDGFETVKALRESVGGNAMIIMISASEWAEMEAQAQALGITRYVSKPFFPSTLVNAIYAALGMKTEPMKRQEDLEAPDLRAYRVLIAEDMEINREIVAAVLDVTGVAIEFAKDGRETVALFSQDPRRYDLVLMDIQMPDMDGYEATKAIRRLGLSRSSAVPIIAMTANAFKEDIDRCLQAGMNDHLAKPIEEKQLFEKLEHYLTKKM